MEANGRHPLNWLLALQRSYRDQIRQGRFFAMLRAASTPAHFQWIRQLYFLSEDFTGAIALRYGSCREDAFRDQFGEHAAEEVTHPAEPAAWMRKFAFIGRDEDPKSVMPTLHTRAIGPYLVRSAIRECLPHQVITLNLMSEGIACDLFATANPKLAELGLTPEGYWAAHAKADLKHERLGLDLIPACSRQSPGGIAYGWIAWEVARLFRDAFDSWADWDSSGPLHVPYRL